MTKQQRVLVVGAGIAGPALAVFLARAGHSCTVVERAPTLRLAGQQIDVNDVGLDIVRKLGIEEQLRARRVFDDGAIYVSPRGDGKPIARFPANNGRFTWVRDLEIMRPDFAIVLYEAARDAGVEFRFGRSVSALRQHDTGVAVTFSGDKMTDADREADFDWVVVADGLYGSTRKLAFPPDNTQMANLDQYASYFTVPWTEADGRHTRWMNAPGGRTVVMRPHIEAGTTGAYLCQITPDAGRLAALPAAQQFDEVCARFADVGWEAQRVMRALREDPAAQKTFYLQNIAQSHSTALATGRVALLGDAGYAPSPVSGEGTALSLIGAYILAGCIASHDDGNNARAMEDYERLMRPFIDNRQKLWPGVPWIVNPQTVAGITILCWALRIISFIADSPVRTLFKSVTAFLPSLGGGGSPLPEFAALQSSKKT